MYKFYILILFLIRINNSRQSLEVCFVPAEPIKPPCIQIVLAEIHKAQSFVKLMAYSYSLDAVTAALCAAVRKGVSCEILMDKKSTRFKYTVVQLEKFTSCGGKAYVDNSSVPIAHNKIMMIDNTTVTTGSINWSNNGFYKNAENMIILRNESVFYDYMNYYNTRMKNSVPFKNFILHEYIDTCKIDLCDRDEYYLF
uniref:Mitochondrial cardiolipin hydrolase n=2 Tax=Parasteatoda tepidariorum TaxID=114398 RepID=A0A2L2XWC6_PARTP